MTLERRMGRLARLYAARDRRERLSLTRPGNHRAIWGLDDAVSRTKLPAGSGSGTRALELLRKARELDAWAGDIG